MKRLLLIVSLSIMAGKIKAQNFPNTLVVWAKDGSSTICALKDLPIVSFTETDLLISSQSAEYIFPLENMSRLSYNYDESSEIYDIKNEEKNIKINNNTIIFPSLKANNTISLFTANGTEIFKKLVSKNGSYSFSIDDLKPGVYLIKVNKSSYKIMKK